MLFNTIAFAKFFCFVFCVSWLLARLPRARFAFLATMSYVFYAGLDLFRLDLWRALAAVDPLNELTHAGVPLACIAVAIALAASRARLSARTADVYVPLALLGVVTAGVVHSLVFRRELAGSGIFQALRAHAPHLVFVPIVFIGSTVDYFLSVWLDMVEDKKKRKVLLLVTILMNTTLLLVFKYWDFVALQVQSAANAMGAHVPDFRLHLPLPIGISFFTFMSLSYVIDVYRREIPASRNYLHYVTYIAFFPHLVAGPIIRGKDLLPLFARSPFLTSAAAGEGMFLIAAGLFKKVVISDYLALNLVDRVVAEPTSFSSLEVLVAMFGYAVQVYCDFSGYSDVAIGAALLLGYRFKINFDAPYKATNVAEFWRRWHISLSSWLRDYIYIPLGGGRHGKARKYFNLWATMVICGIWHGAAWSFVLFGVVQGFAVLVTHAYFEARGMKPGEGEAEGLSLGRVVATLVTFVFTSLTFVLIRAPLDTALLMYRQLFQLTTFAPNLHRSILLVILGALVLQWFPRRHFVAVRDAFIRAPAIVQALVLFGIALALREASSTEAVPFVYFQF